MKKRIISLCMIASMLLMQSVSAATMYALDGRTLEVDDSEIEAYRQVNWYYGRPVTMYALDGRTLTVGENDVEMYRQVNWYYGKPVTMHALDGRTLTVGENDVEMYRQVGWYYGKPVTMYAPDGRTLIVGQNDVAMYKAVGWYTAPVTTLNINTNVINSIGATYGELEQKFGTIDQAFNDLGAAFYKLGYQTFWGAFYNRASKEVYVVNNPYDINVKGDYGFVTPDYNSVCISIEGLAHDLFNNLNGSLTLSQIYNSTGIQFVNHGISEMDGLYMLSATLDTMTITISSENTTIEDTDFMHIKAHNYDTVSSLGPLY